MKFLSILLILFFNSFQQDYVLVCKSGTAYAYHKTTCRGLKECTHTVVKMTPAVAVKAGRKPCGYCYKSKATTVYPVAGGNKPAAGSSGQCTATTQKGTRCSRAAKYSGYCWQHK